MHGDREVATGVLAREIGAKRVRPCEAATAEQHTGERVDGTSPFGTRRGMPMHCEESIAELPRIYINYGKRGYIIAMRTRDALDLLKPRLVNAARRSQLYQGLLELDARINDISEGDPGRPLLASHPLYQYLARRYGLNPRSVAWGPEEVPSEQQWTALKGILREHPAKWMLWEGAPAEETVERSRALGVKSVVVNPCGNRPAVGAFLTVMSEYARNLERIFRQVSGDP